MQSNRNYKFTGIEDSNDFKKYVEKETDLTHDSPFHTLGKGATQAAPGNHSHPNLPSVSVGVAPSNPKVGDIWCY